MYTCIIVIWRGSASNDAAASHFFDIIPHILISSSSINAAWTLNKHKELRIFLKGESPSSSSSSAGRAKPVGEIMEYDGITIDWVRGKKAILTIYDEDGKQIKDVPLFELKTRKDMHQFMIDEGFHKKTQQEKVEEIQVERREKQLEQISDGGPSSFYNTITGLYVMVFVVLAGKLRQFLFLKKTMYAE